VTGAETKSATLDKWKYEAATHTR